MISADHAAWTIQEAASNPSFHASPFFIWFSSAKRLRYLGYAGKSDLRVQRHGCGRDADGVQAFHQRSPATATHTAQPGDGNLLPSFFYPVDPEWSFKHASVVYIKFDQM